MGNCIDKLCSPSEDITQIFNGGEEDSKPSTPLVEEITFDSYHGYKNLEFPNPDCKLMISGNINSVHPPFTGPCSPPVSQKMNGEEDGCGVRSIKVVLTKKQLEELLLLSSSGKEVIPSAEEFAVRVLQTSQLGEPYQKWKPSLPSIPESLIC